MTARLSDGDVTARVDARHWRVLLGRLHATFATGSFDVGVVLVDRIGALAAEVDHHPDVDLRYPAVHVSLVSHDAGGLTEADVTLSGRISAAADELGIVGAPATSQALEVAIDALDIAAVLPFWRAVLGYADERLSDEGSSPALVDPSGIGAAFWFQQMDAPRPQRNRVHIDVTVPHDVALDRVAAALAAGGHMVTDEFAPSWWVLADAEGNEACVCTWQGRG